MTQEEYNKQFYDDLGKIINNQQIICAKLDTIQSDITVIIDNQLGASRHYNNTQETLISKLKTIQLDLDSISRATRSKT
jgi:hypothetical protein